LLIIIYNHFKQKYNSGQTLGIELGAMYWHFLDFLWIYLFVFIFSLNKKNVNLGTLTNNFLGSTVTTENEKKKGEEMSQWEQVMVN
jgi:hypothetical protein